MRSGRIARQVALAASGVAVAVMVVVSACAPSAKEVPPTTSTSPSNSASLTPSDKSLSPRGSGAFSPTALNPLPSLVPTT